VKIGIITYFGDFNCGTNLQAFATYQALKTVFPNDDIKIANYHGFKQFTLPYFTSATAVTILNDLKRYFKYRYFWNTSLNVKSSKVISNVNEALQFIKSKNYDRIYVGSDTLLELNRLRYDFDGISSYWLSPDIKADKFFLSASCNNVIFDNLSEFQKELIAKTLKDFKGYYIRDKVTQRLFVNFVDIDKIRLSPDPTFSLEIDYALSEIYWERKWSKLKGKKVICFHTLKGEQWPIELASKLRSEGYVIASLRTARWADIILNDLSPFEQLGIYCKFDFMITHRFHDTIFCLKNGTPVIAYPINRDVDEIGESKCKGLLEWFNLEKDCFIEDFASIRSDVMLMRIESVKGVFFNNVKNIKSTCSDLGNLYMDIVKSTL